MNHKEPSTARTTMSFGEFSQSAGRGVGDGRVRQCHRVASVTFERLTVQLKLRDAPHAVLAGRRAARFWNETAIAVRARFDTLV